MVFRNPYGFLIKHFKMIHLILTGLYIYLAVKVSRILQYYNQFIAGTASKLDAISYVTNYYWVAIILSIVACLIIYALMRYKKKPRVLYLILIVLYIVVAVMIGLSYKGLNTIYISVLETKTLRLYRDLLNILIWFQYVSVAVVLVRGLGFDIKKFNFVQDLAELHIDVSDEEEVELTLGSTESIQRKAHRGLREFKYYYLENKVFIWIILAIVLVVLGGTFYVHHEVIAKEYREGETFSSEEFRFQVLNTFVTNRNYSNQIITRTDTSFVVIRLSLGTNREERTFNTSNLVLKINHNSYAPNKKYTAHFSDLGVGYRGEKVNAQKTYLFIYNIDNEDLDGKMSLVYAGDKTVRLNPIFVDEISDTKNYKLGEEINFTDSTLGSGHFKISSYEVNEKFSYSYQYEVMGQMNTSNLTISSTQGTILHLMIDSEYPFTFTDYSILSELGKLKYKVGEEVLTSVTFSDKTPGNYKEGLYLAVDKRIEEASSIWFEITIRNCQYIYRLK